MSRIATVSREFFIAVDYSRILKHCIVAGRYEYDHPMLNIINFPPDQEEQGFKEKSFVYYGFNEESCRNWIVSEMRNDGRRPAKLREVLAFGQAQPNLQRRFLITGLGSSCVIDSTRFFPTLAGYHGYGRSIDLRSNEEWPLYYEFLAVNM